METPCLPVKYRPENRAFCKDTMLACDVLTRNIYLGNTFDQAARLYGDAIARDFHPLPLSNIIYAKNKCRIITPVRAQVNRQPYGMYFFGIGTSDGNPKLTVTNTDVERFRYHTPSR